MSTDSRTNGDPKPKSPATVAQLVAFTKQELKADDERQAKVSADGTEELPRESQAGATLDLSHKAIRALPVEVIALIKDRVERLALSHNPQVTVPTDIVQCDRLRYLNLRWTQQELFPEAVLQLSRLEILDISKNRISSIPEEIRNMTSLKFLAVARNKITRLPLALGEMNSLHKLKFDENPIEYPPPDALKLPTDKMESVLDSELEKEICKQVKRWLKAAALRQRLCTSSSEDLSESNVETPRPPRRSGAGGRFPVRPSVGNIENIDDLRVTQSPKGPPPPIPLRSHARDLSGTAPPGRRTGAPPLSLGGDEMTRSRSDTASTTSSVRSRRQGFVPRKNPEHGSLSELSTSASSRSSQSTLRAAAHSRASSSVSTSNGFLSAGSGGETSSDAVSPVDAPLSRYGSMRRLSSLPESRNSRLHAGEVVKAARRLVYVFLQLLRPMEDLVRTLGNGTPRRSTPGRLLAIANADVQMLDGLLAQLDNSLAYQATDVDTELRSIVEKSITSLKAYSTVAQEVRQHVQKAVSHPDGAYVRCVMHQIYYTLIEARNICITLGFKIRSIQRDAPRASRAPSSRAITPTQGKSVKSRRLRGATILRHIQSGTLQNENRIRTMAPVPPSAGSSRTNTMTSLSAATPRSTDSFSTVPSMTRSRSVPDESDNDEQFDRIFLKLQSACDLARQSLPRCRQEFIVRKESAEGTGQTNAAHSWAKAISKCDAVFTAISALLNRLSMVKLKDPTVRYQRDFWQLCDAFVHSCVDLLTEYKNISQRVDTVALKSLLKPVQKAVKEVSKTISESPLYQQARAGPLAPPFSAGTLSNNSFPPPMLGSGGAYMTPVPPTPLSAALGPAVQATVANTTSVPIDYGNYYNTAIRATPPSVYERHGEVQPRR